MSRPGTTAFRLSIVAAAWASIITPAAADDGWSVTATPYVWAAGVDGRVDHPLLPASISATAGFGDVLERLDIGGMIALEARKGRFGILAEGMHIAMSDRASLPVLGLPVDLSTRTSGALLSGELRFIDGDAVSVDALAGVRYWSISTRIRYAVPDGVPLPPGIPLPRTYDTRRGSDWVDAMTGLKARAQLGAAVSLTATGMIGFGGSDLVTDLSLLLGVETGRRTSLVIGYRRLDVDYSSGGFTFDANVHGPLAGLAVRF